MRSFCKIGGSENLRYTLFKKKKKKKKKKKTNRCIWLNSTYTSTEELDTNKSNKRTVIVWDSATSWIQKSLTRKFEKQVWI